MSTGPTRPAAAEELSAGTAVARGADTAVAAVAGVSASAAIAPQHCSVGTIGAVATASCGGRGPAAVAAGTAVSEEHSAPARHAGVRSISRAKAGIALLEAACSAVTGCSAVTPQSGTVSTIAAAPADACCGHTRAARTAGTTAAEQQPGGPSVATVPAAGTRAA